MRAKIFKSVLILVLLAGWAGFSVPSHAATVTFESASQGDTGQTDGFLSLSNGPVYYGFGFTLSEAFDVAQIGGHILGAPPVISNDQLFGAIVSLGDSLTAPTFLPSELASNALVSTTFDAPYASDQVFVDLPYHLDPGYYAVIIGSNTGTFFGGFPTNNTVSDNPYMFNSTSGSFQEYSEGSTDVRLFVNGEFSPVPVPAALPLFLSGLAGLGVVGWRRRKAASGRNA